MLALLLCQWLALVRPAAAEVIVADISVEASAQAVVFRNEAIELTFDTQTGAWTRLVDGASGSELMGPTVSKEPVGERAGWFLPPRSSLSWRYGDYRVRAEGGSALLEIDQQAEGWRATASYRLWPGRPVVKRDLSLTPTFSSDEYTRNVRLSVAGLGIAGAPDASYEVLANWPPEQVPLWSLIPGREVSESWSGSVGHFVLVHSPARQLGVATLLGCETESSGMRVVEGASAINVDHLIWTVFRPEEGKTERFGSQLLAVTHGDRRAALTQGRDLWDLAGIRPPQDMLQEAQQTVFYSAHPGGTIDSGFRDVGGFAQFAKGLPELKRLGVNVLWLLPFWKGPVYAPSDYFALDESLGTEDDLGALVSQAHSLGIKVLGDLIPHGPLEVSGLHEQHRDWVSTNEDGTMQYWWGCLSCDYAHPGWQGYMGEHAAYWVKRVGLDGYRVDCAAGGPLNYRPFGENRPSMSNTYGGQQVLRVAREKMHAEKERVLLLAEAANPILLRHSDYYYDWPLCWNILKSFGNWRTEEFVPKLARWLDNEQFWLPKDANLMHFLENHDSTRARLVHGPGPERALMALCALIPGSPLVYHLQETGLAPYLQKLYQVRAGLPELTQGDADFTSVRCSDPRVLVFTRTYEGHSSVIAINLSEQQVHCQLTLPESLAGFRPAALPVFDSPAGMRPIDGGIELHLNPFRTVIITEDGRPVPPLPMPQMLSDTDEGQVAAPTVTEAGDDLVLTNAELKLTIDRKHGGLLRSVQDREGNLLLRVLDFGEGPRRLWLGTERLALSRQADCDVTFSADQQRQEAFVTARGTLVRLEGDRKRPLASYTVQYALGPSRRAEVRYEFTALEPIRNVLGSLVETLQLDPQATEWCVNSQEGFLHDWAVSRLPGDTKYTALYANGAGDRVWQSRDTPLGFAAAMMDAPSPLIAVRGTSGNWLHLLPRAGTGDNVMLKMRHGESVGPHVVFEWLDGRRSVNLDAGRTLHFGYDLWVRGWEADSIESISGRQPRPSPAAVPVLRSRGTHYEVSNGKYELALSRFGGGKIVDFRLPGDAEPLISGSKIYTDGGIYSQRTTPDMQKVAQYIATEADPEAEVGFTAGPPLRLTFSGILRDSDGRGVPSPQVQYRVTYEIDRTETLKVRAAVRCLKPIPQAEAFLAQTLTLPRFSGYEVNAKAGLASAMVAPGGERVWESKTEGFGAEPWMVCHTGDGRALRVAGADLATQLQNAFLYRAGNEGVVFLAWNDFVAADIEPIWRELSYTLTPMREGR